MGKPSVRERLDAIEADLRAAAGISDPLVRRALTSMLLRQTEYRRDLLASPRPPGGRCAGGGAPSSVASRHP